MGAGPIGLFTLQVAQVYGLKNIVVVDLNEERLEMMKELGGVSATNLQEITNQDHLMRPSMRWALNSRRVQCMEYVRPGGSVVFF